MRIRSTTSGAFWPDLVAEDSGLARLRFGVRARNGAAGQGCSTTCVSAAPATSSSGRSGPSGTLMRRLAPAYPDVTQLLGAEVSMVRHLNVFMEDFELYPYPPTGKAPVLDNSVAAAEKIVRWYHDRGALVQYNHPPIEARRARARPGRSAPT